MPNADNQDNVDHVIKEWGKERIKSEPRNLFWLKRNHPFFYYSIFASYFFIAYLAYYTIYNQFFFPSQAWETIGSYISPLIAGLIFLFSFRRTCQRIDAGKLARAQAPKIFAGVGFFCFCIWGFFWLGVFLGGGRVYTQYFGHDYSQTVSATKTKKERSYRRIHTLYCLDTPELLQGEFSQICIPFEQFKTAPDSFQILLTGKKSWFGFLVEGETIENR